MLIQPNIKTPIIVMAPDLGGQNFGIAVGSGVISDIIDRSSATVFADIVDCNIRAATAPTTGKFTIKVWTEDFSSFSFNSVSAGTFIEGTTVTLPYGNAPVAYEVDGVNMFDGATQKRLYPSFNVASLFANRVPLSYRLIFLNNTDAVIQCGTLRFSNQLAVVTGMAAESI